MAPVTLSPAFRQRTFPRAFLCGITVLLLAAVSPLRAATHELLLKLGSETNQETKASIIGQLQFTAKDDAVPVLAAYLADERLCDPAARTLVSIGTRRAAKALLQSLRSAHAGRVVSVVQALGDLAYTPAIPDVQRFATDTAAGLRRAAWYTLAQCGDRSLVPVLKKYREADRFVATAELFRLARRLEDGSICRYVLQAQPTPAEHSQALEILAEVDGRHALPEVGKALESTETAVRLTAVRTLATMSSSQARRLLRDAMRNSDPAVRATALGALVQLNERTAQAACATALTDTHAVVRAEAIRGWKAGPGLLVDFLPHASKDELTGIARVLQSVRPVELTGRWSKADAGMKVALLSVVAALNCAEFDRMVWLATDDADAGVRLAALAALKVRGSPADLPAALSLLGRLQGETEVQEAQALAIELGGELPDGQAGALALTAMSQSQAATRSRFYVTLSSFGGTNALAALANAAHQDDAVLQDAAVRALSNSRDASALPLLLEICRGGKTDTHKVLAARGAMRLAEHSRAGKDEIIVMWRSILDAAPREEEKQQALAALRRLQEKAKP